MKKKKIDYLQKLYEKNQVTGNYVIQVGLDKYTDVFNDWDNAPFKKRDMDPDLAVFLENCSDDIPIKYGVDICFYLPKEVQDKKREEVLIAGIRTYYSFYLHSQIKFLRESYQKMLTYIVISFTLLFTSVILGISDNVIYSTVTQGINIGGWVFLWEAISMFFFRRRQVVVEIKKYRRFLNSLIYFKYGNDSTTSGSEQV